LGAPSKDFAGNFTGYSPGGKTGSAPRGGGAEEGAALHESAFGPGEPWALRFSAPITSAAIPTIVNAAVVDRRSVRFTRVEWDITTSSTHEFVYGTRFLF
jgi:hypothetical protein